VLNVFALFLCQNLKRHAEEMHNRMEVSKKQKEVEEDGYENSVNKVNCFSKISLLLGYIMCLQSLM
jgi:Ca2+/H+ antiporter